MLEKFSTVLMFESKGSRIYSEWVSDDRLQSNMDRLVNQYGEKKEEEWLVYFVKVLKVNNNGSLEEKEMARQHLSCYYQDTGFWVTKNFWLERVATQYWQGQPLWEWETLFEKAMETFADMKRTIMDLKKLEPDVSTKSYVKKRLYYNLANWADSQIGRGVRVSTISIDLDPGEGRVEIANLTSDDPEMLNERSLYPENQERVYSVLIKEMREIEASAVKSDRANVWNLCQLNYGLGLSQQDIAELLAANVPISPSTLSRKIKDLKLKLALKVIEEFKQELGWSDREADKSQELQKEREFKTRVKAIQGAVGDFLKEYCADYVAAAVIELANKETARDPRIVEKKELLARSLNVWLQTYLKISTEVPLTGRLEKKIETWVERLSHQLRDPPDRARPQSDTLVSGGYIMGQRDNDGLL
ncbi:MAG: hypothetical protein F6J93_26790 [Oscillatoria sp. SIO1A7]|nr:hypothetical protein [Oscillatoria sp. SIO1A7]